MADLIDIDEARKRAGGSRPIGRSTFYERIKQGKFPQPVKLGPRISRWRADELDAALDRMANERPEPPEAA